MGVGELIGARCRDADGVAVGDVVYVERDDRGRPRWFDVRFDADLLDAQGWDCTRVRMAVEWIRAWDPERGTVTLDRPVGALSDRWWPVGPETLSEPTF